MTRIRIRRGTSSEWSSRNPILTDGELGYDKTVKKLKMGDGFTPWNSLGYLTTQGAKGEDGAPGAEGGTTTLTTDGDILTRAAGSLARITRDNLAQDPAFSGRYLPLPKSPGPRRPTPSSVVTSFQSGHGWVNPFGWGTLTDETNAADYFIGTQSFSLYGNNVATAAQKTGLALDLTDKILGLWVRIDDISKVDQIIVFAGNSGLTANWAWAFAKEAASAPMFRSGEWQFITLPWGTAVATGSPNRAAIATIRIRVYAESGQEAKAYFQQVVVIPELASKYPTGVASIMWDDGYTSTLEAARRAFAPYGFRGSVGIIPDTVGTAGFLTVDQVKSLQRDYGWEVVTHAITTMTTQSAAELQATIIANRMWFTENGIDPRGTDHLVYPGGQVDAEVIDVVSGYYASGRAICEAGLMESLPPADPYKIRASSSISSFSGGVSAATIEARIDTAVANHNWLILVFHRASDTPASTLDCTYADLATIAAKLQSSGIAVRPFGEVLADLAGA